MLPQANWFSSAHCVSRVIYRSISRRCQVIILRMGIAASSYPARNHQVRHMAKLLPHVCEHWRTPAESRVCRFAICRAGVNTGDFLQPPTNDRKHPPKV